MRIFLSVFLGASLVYAAADPAAAGMDAAQLNKIAPRMKEYVDSGYIPGVVTLVKRKGVVTHFEAVGWQDVEGRKPMKPDTIFQIMSMTKPITGVAIMMLVEEGRLRIADPVERHLPEFRGQMLVASRDGGQVVLRKPSRPITIRDLMTHTSGMIMNPPPGIAELLLTMDRSLAEAVAIYGQQPLEFEPGSRWQYSNPGIATLGRIVEVVSGMPYEKFIAERIFQPLGMKDSHIVLPADKRARLAPIYMLKDGKLTLSGADTLGGDSTKFRPNARYSGPEYAVYSTAPDLANFYQMMLDHGVFNGKRLLSRAAVETMTVSYAGDMNPAGWLPGVCYGLTWEIACRPDGSLTFLSPGTFAHGGAFGTYGWVDPKRGMVGVFMIQMSQNRQDVRDAFIAMANAAVLE